MLLARTVTFRRVPLAQAARTLTAAELQLLLVLALGACPRTRRVWVTPLRLAEELAPERDAAADRPRIDAMLSTLVTRGHMSLWSKGHGALVCYELDPVLVGVVDAPPHNLPVEPVP